MRTFWKLLALWTCVGLLFTTVDVTPPAARAEGVTGIEIQYFDVPAEFRVDTDYVVTAGLRNNGTSEVRNLRVEFRIDGNLANFSTVDAIAPASSKNVSVALRTSGNSGRTLDFEVTAGGASLSVQRLVRSLLKPSVSIWNFRVSPDTTTTQTKDITLVYTLKLALNNSGETTGQVVLSVYVTPGEEAERTIYSQSYSVSEKNPQNISFDWTYKAKARTERTCLYFRAAITGDVAQTQSNEAFYADILDRTPVENKDQGRMVLTVFVVVLMMSVVMIFILGGVWKKKADGADEKGTGTKRAADGEE